MDKTLTTSRNGKKRRKKSSSTNPFFYNISEQTGLPVSTLIKIKRSMKKRDSYSCLEKFSNHPGLPSIETIIYKLLHGHQLKQKSFQSRSGKSMYQLSLRAPIGKVKISSSIYSKTSYSLIDGSSRKDLLFIKYTVTLGGETVSYKQYIYLKNCQYINSKHYIKSLLVEPVAIGNVNAGVKLLRPPEVVLLA